jgi:hypothetical protein
MGPQRTRLAAVSFGIGVRALRATGAGVAQRAVVEVHGVLAGDDEPTPRALFHQGDKLPFGRRGARVEQSARDESIRPMSTGSYKGPRLATHGGPDAAAHMIE